MSEILSKKKIAVITGASQGIGRAISVKLASKGYITVLAGRNEENLRKTAEFVSQVNDNYQVSITDVTSEVDVEALFKEIEELGELAECFTKSKSKDEKAEELADILILTLGHSIAMNVDLESAFDKKMAKIMKRSAISGDFGIRVTDYKK